MPLETRPYDSARYLDSDEAIAGYLEAAFEIDDPAFIAKAIGIIAQARGMTQIAKDAGISRESLYEALVGNENPEFSILQKVVKALGLRLAVAAAE
jgi:probable addiction module antidote protein